MNQYSSNQSGHDRWVWFGVIAIIAGYSLWHFNFLPGNIKAYFTAHDHHQAELVKFPQEEVVKPLDPQLKQQMVEPLNVAYSEPGDSETGNADFNSVWNQYDEFLEHKNENLEVQSVGLFDAQKTHHVYKKNVDQMNKAMQKVYNEQQQNQGMQNISGTQSYSHLTPPEQMSQQGNPQQQKIGYPQNPKQKANTQYIPGHTGNTPIQLVSGTSQTANTQRNISANQPGKTAGLNSTNGNPDQDILALRELSQIYWSQPQQRPAIQKQIDTISRKIFFSGKTHYFPAHTIKAGENLGTIARNYNVPWEYLARLNQVNPNKIKAGDSLKVIKGPFSVKVDKSDFEMIVHTNGYYVCRFNVGIGADKKTPQGKFKVLNKEKNPAYFGPEGVIDRNDPRNPIGERWLDLGDSIGIHGTIDPQSIGKAESKGCVRMNNQDVELLYDLLVIGSEVIIVD